MEMNLNQIEKDFIEFLSIKENRPYKEIENIYILTKNTFNFSSLEYRELTGIIHDLYKIIYDDTDEKRLIDSYKFHALIHLFRFISYSYPRSDPKYSDYLKSLMRVIIKGELDRLYAFIKRKISNKPKNFEPKDFRAIAKFLVGEIKKSPIIVDYGCGLGYISFEIGKLKRISKIYLVDIDCLTLEFAYFRFKKHGINVEVIPISKNNIYPKLPKHNICIATEVMEHVMQPLTVYQNIYRSLEEGGILYGNFADHQEEMFHVSPNLNELRNKIAKNFKELNSQCYKKIS